MAHGALYQSNHVSEVMHSRSGPVPYPVHMSNRITIDTDQPPGEQPTARFARIIRSAREQRGWTQDDLAEAADVSRPTVQRFENGKTATPHPTAARKVFRALGLDPRLIPVILGYVTPEEMDLPAQAPQVLTPTAEEALRILMDPAVPAATKDEWLRFLQFRTRESVEGPQETPRAG